MQKKMLIAIDEDVYAALRRVVGRGKMSKFVEDVLRPHVFGCLDGGYKAMAADKEREGEAIELCNTIAGGMADETR